jgi:hypothetical protein
MAISKKQQREIERKATEARIRNAKEALELQAKYSRAEPSEVSKRNARRLSRGHRPRRHVLPGSHSWLAKMREKAKGVLDEIRDYDLKLLPKRASAVTALYPPLPGVDTRPVKPYTGAPLRQVQIRSDLPPVIALKDDPVPYVPLPQTKKQIAKGDKIVASSFERYNGGARVKREHGSSTVTRFYVHFARDRDDPSKWKTVEGYGRTPGDRKTDAIRRSGLLGSGE